MSGQRSASRPRAASSSVGRFHVERISGTFPAQTS